MFIYERNFGIFKFVNVFFAEAPVTDNLPDCDVLTYYTYKNWGDIKGFDRTKRYKLTIDLRPDISCIWNQMKRQRKRHIRRAEKNGTIVKVSINYEKFYRSYKRFLKEKNNADPLGLFIFSSKFMQKYGTLFIAENQGELLGGYLYFHDGYYACLVNVAYQNIGNTIDQKKQIFDANCYMHWEAMRYFKNMGIIRYDLGTVDCYEIYKNRQMSGADYFKRSFGGEVISDYQYMKFNSPISKLLFLTYNFLRK